MKTGLKKIIAFIIATIIMASPCAVLANNIEEENTSTKTVEQTKEAVETKKTIGNMEVDIEFALPIKNMSEVNMKIVVADEQNNKIELDLNGIAIEKTITKTIKDKEIQIKIRKLDQSGMPVQASTEVAVNYFGITFYGLEEGTYSISIEGEGYVNYTVSNIQLKEYSKRISIANNASFLAGDLNTDGIINEKDADLVMEYIGNKEKTKIEKYDLNRDGKIDIVDLAYIAENKNAVKKEASIIDTTAMVDTSKTTITGDIKKGTVEDLFSGNTSKTVTMETEQEISEKNPAKIEINFTEAKKTEEIRIEPSSLTTSNAPVVGTIEVTDSNGKIHTFPYNVTAAEEGEEHKFTDTAVTGTIIINLGGQIAVKKVTIKVTQTNTKNTNLAEIAKVELLNNVYETVPVPKMDIPTELTVTPKDEELLVKWNHAENVTGYELRVQEMQGAQILSTEIYETDFNSYEVKNLDNYKTYTLSIQSVNGEWKSGYSKSIEGMPIPNRLPPVPDNISIVEKYLRLEISWKKMKDTLTYNLYYKAEGETELQKIANIETNSYALDNLTTGKTYEIYVSGNNHMGEGKKTNLFKGKPIPSTPTITPKYKLINTSNGVGKLTAHIQDVQKKLGNNTPADNKYVVVDEDYTTHWTVEDWTSGADYNTEGAPIVELDQEYTMNKMIIALPDSGTYSYYKALINYWDTKGEKTQTSEVTISQKTDKNGKKYFVVQTAKPITAKKIQVMVSSYSRLVSYTELKFYHYDSMEDEVSALFKDDLRIELQETVTAQTIANLETRVNTLDPVSQEYHPNKETIVADLNYAKKILNDTAISEIITVDQNINSDKNGYLGFSMRLNDFQPLGVVARAGEEIAIYVGTKGNIMPQIIFTQYNAESGKWNQTVTNLKKGQNIIEVPKLTGMDVEKGGSIYVRYPATTPTDKPIKIRVSGGQKIPVLDIHGLTDQTQIKAKIKDYIQTLKTHVKELPEYYKDKEYAYNVQTSIANSTEIVTNNVILSIPAEEALTGIKGGTEAEEVTRLYNSMTAFEEMIALFYKEKGLSANPVDAVDALPSSRISIRCMRMFDGAFMYAGGQIIGIGHGSAAGLMRGTPKQLQANGSYLATGYFGWGIAHEVGHVIDEGNMIYKETSNNIYSLFAQTADDVQLSRLETSFYETIYEKVTSHTKGISSNGGTTLGMFWQLHLAYDKEKTLSSTNTFYARLNHLYRTTTLTLDRDNLLIALASEAAGKDLTTYFENWGLIANEETKAYIASKGLEPETRSIYYLNDGARRYSLNGGTAINSTTEVTGTLENVKDQNGNMTKNMKLTFGINSNEHDKILGYEIIRNGVSVAFVEGNTKEYIDSINAVNNRAFTYEVIAYDKLLNKTKTLTFAPIKIEHDGSISKDKFTIVSNFKNEKDIIDAENPEAPVETSIYNLIDGNNATIFKGNTRITSTEKEDAYIQIDLNSKMPISGIKYTAAVENGSLTLGTIKDFEIYYSEDNVEYTLVKKASMNKITAQNPTQIIYFDKPGVTGENQLFTALTGYIKIKIPGAQVISGAEIDLISQPGDNINLDANNIGVLKEDYKYAEPTETDTGIIKAGSVIFKGNYRGNPAFNVVLLIDGKEQVIDNEQLFMASLPENSAPEAVADGNFIAYMSKEAYAKLVNEGNGKVKLNLYRVNDALNVTGQRLVSDTTYINLKPLTELLEIVLESGK